eukprot:g15365.t1
MLWQWYRTAGMSTGDAATESSEPVPVLVPSAEQIAALTGAPVPSPSGPKTSESSGKKKKKGPPPAVSTARVGPSLESVKALKEMRVFAAPEVLKSP